MACQMRDCGHEHVGIHFRLFADPFVVIDFFAGETAFLLRDTKFDVTISIGRMDSILAAAYEGQIEGVKASENLYPSNMVWNRQLNVWDLSYGQRIISLFNLPPCVLAGTEMWYTKRPGKPGYTSVMLGGVPIKKSYEFTGAGLVTPGGQP